MFEKCISVYKITGWIGIRDYKWPLITGVATNVIISLRFHELRTTISWIKRLIFSDITHTDYSANESLGSKPSNIAVILFIYQLGLCILLLMYCLWMFLYKLTLSIWNRLNGTEAIAARSLLHQTGFILMYMLFILGCVCFMTSQHHTVDQNNWRLTSAMDSRPLNNVVTSCLQRSSELGLFYTTGVAGQTWCAPYINR